MTWNLKAVHSEQHMQPTCDYEHFLWIKSESLLHLLSHAYTLLALNLIAGPWNKNMIYEVHYAGWLYGLQCVFISVINVRIIKKIFEYVIPIPQACALRKLYIKQQFHYHQPRYR